MKVEEKSGRIPRKRTERHPIKLIAIDEEEETILADFINKIHHDENPDAHPPSHVKSLVIYVGKSEIGEIVYDGLG